MARAAALLAMIGFAGCVGSQEIGEIKAKIIELEGKQDQVLAQLDELSKGQTQILAKVPAAVARPTRPAEDPNKVYEVPIGNSYSKGSKDAAVTIVEFSDFQCPFCAQAASLIKQILEAYPNDVRFIYKNYPLPFHNEAMPAARAAVAAGKQGKFWEMHDKLFENYRGLSSDFYTKVAEELGLDVERFRKDLDDPATATFVQQEVREAGTVGVRGTPTFFINGKKPQGRSFSLYKQIIDRILKEKKAG
ncbi:MAG: DsbA family protein [Candidatus Binatia bacterium]